MALTATKSPAGIVPHRSIGPDEIFYAAGDPGDTVGHGNALICSAGEGVLDLCGDSEVPFAMAQKKVVMAANTTAFPKPADFDPASDASNTLVPVKILGSAGVPIYHATFAGQTDDTVVSYTASTRAIAATTGCAADDRPNGGILYVYSGPGAGEMNIVEDYDHSGGAAALLTICHRAFATTLTTSSLYIVLYGEAAGSRGISPFGGRIDLADHDNLDVTDGANDGDWVTVLSWESGPKYLSQLTLPVIPAVSVM